jgi:hypothetical protein
MQHSLRTQVSCECAWLLLAVYVFQLAACQQQKEPPAFSVDAPLLINEIVANNEGVWVDEAGETDDFIELLNQSDAPLRLGEFNLSDAYDNGTQLPDVILNPHQTMLIWADGSPHQGPNHMPFKLSSAGESVYLSKHLGPLVGRVPFGALDANLSFSRRSENGKPLAAFEVCRYPTPLKPNISCTPPAPPELPDDVTFARFSWPAPTAASPLALTELALRPSLGNFAFVELLNTTDQTINANNFALRISSTKPGLPWPEATYGADIPIPAESLIPPGARLAVPVPAESLAELSKDPLFEGVITLFNAQDQVVDRTDFMHWPVGSALARPENDLGDFKFCQQVTPGEANTLCAPLLSRDVGDRVRHLRTPGDFAALAAGGTALAEQAVKVIVDIARGETVHLLSTRAWALHYTFVRETIDKAPRLNLCDAAQNAAFWQGWVDFSAKEYFVTEGRHYLSGTLVKHGGTKMQTLEFAVGDVINGAQMKQAFFAASKSLPDPQKWTVRPQSPGQVTAIRASEGQMPIVGPNAPFRGQTYQPLTAAVGFGVLRFVPSTELASATIDPRTILITDDVPNDINLVGGLITESFQAPLAHVNVLSKGRGTPNMALRNARQDPRLTDLLGKPVRIEVRADDFDIRLATAAEVDAHWAKQFGGGPLIQARLDTTVRNLVPLSAAGFVDLPSIGAKAAQLAELGHIHSVEKACPGDMGTPANAFAVPIVHSVEHSTKSGAQKLITELLASAALRQDVEKRDVILEKIRTAILTTPVSRNLQADVEGAIKSRFGTQRVRMRSSSNTEDLPEFNGAGLYQSTSAAIGDPDRTIANGLRTVWASLWRPRAFAERELAHIDHRSIGVAVLVHEEFGSEKANGVAVSRSLSDPNEVDVYYVNAQFGEASVTNPAPGIATEELLYRWFRDPPVVYQSRSTFVPDRPVMQLSEIEQLVCRLNIISAHFRPLIDPQKKQPWFAMEVEFKLMLNPQDPNGAKRLVIKQTRPYSFGHPDIPADCREQL